MFCRYRQPAITACIRAGVPKLHPLEGLMVGHGPKANTYIIVLLKCKIIRGSKVPLVNTFCLCATGFASLLTSLVQMCLPVQSVTLPTLLRL